MLALLHLALSIAAATTSAQQIEHVSLITPDTTSAQLELVVAQGVSARRAARGARPVFRVARPLVVGRDTVVAAGAEVWATVRDARGERTLGVPGRFTYMIDSTRTIDGRTLLVGAPETMTGSRRRVATITAGVLTYGPGAFGVTGGPTILGRCESLVVPVELPLRTAPSAASMNATTSPPAESCTPQEYAVRRGSVRSELTGAVIGYFFPGAGHLYAGATRTGLALMGTAVGGASIIVASLRDEPQRDHVGETVTGLGVIAAAIGVSVVDAPRAVRRYNERALLDPFERKEARTLARGARNGVSVRPILRMVAAPTSDDAHHSAPAIGLHIH